MRIHVMLDDELVADLDRRAGARRRSAYISELIARGLEDDRRWDETESALGSLPDSGPDRGPATDTRNPTAEHDRCA